MEPLKIVFICSSNRDRSPALEKHFREKYPQHQYRSAGANEYFCGKHGSHYLSPADLDWADVVVFAEDIIRQSVIDKGFRFSDKISLALNCGHFERDEKNSEYIEKAERIIVRYLSLKNGNRS